jgi:hypothetical protein
MPPQPAVARPRAKTVFTAFGFARRDKNLMTSCLTNYPRAFPAQYLLFYYCFLYPGLSFVATFVADYRRSLQYSTPSVIILLLGLESTDGLN